MIATEKLAWYSIVGLLVVFAILSTILVVKYMDPKTDVSTSESNIECNCNCNPTFEILNNITINDTRIYNQTIGLE